jgi:hypothetical protein
VSGSDSPEVGHVGDGADREAAVDQAVVDEHVGHAEQRNPEALWGQDTWKVRPQSDAMLRVADATVAVAPTDSRLTAPKQRPATRPRWKKP